MKRALFAILIAGVTASCKAPEEPATEPAPDPTPAAAPEAAAVEAVLCTFSRSTALIENVRLESEDGACKLYLPTPVREGIFDVRVSASGDVAAVEAEDADGTLYATGGTLTISAVADGRVQGTLTAEDDAPPATGNVTATFDVALP